MNLSIRSYHACVGLLLTCLIVGCAPEKSKFVTATVQGIVKIDGTPVKEGTIQFMPTTGVSGQPTTVKIADGKFIAKDVPVGKVRALFSISRPTGKMITEYSSSYPEIENLVPEQYRSGVEVDVTGNDNIPFDLVNTPVEEKEQ